LSIEVFCVTFCILSIEVFCVTFCILSIEVFCVTFCILSIEVLCVTFCILSIEVLCVTFCFLSIEVFCVTFCILSIEVFVYMLIWTLFQKNLICNNLCFTDIATWCHILWEYYWPSWSYGSWNNNYLCRRFPPTIELTPTI
jgi:hypothetical protein